MMKLINYLSKNKYLQISLIIFALYSVLFIFSPFNQRIGDFIIDYEIINSVNNSNVFKSLLHTNSFCGSVLNNLITLINYKLFNYSDTFIKIINYILNISILFLTYYLFVQNNSNKKRYGAYFLFLLLAVDFFGVFQTASMNHIKIMIVINLLSFVLFNKSLSLNDKNKKYLFSILSVALQLFAFNFTSILIYCYLLYKNNENKQIYISTIITYIICLLFNYQIFVNISNYGFTARLIYTLASPIAPIIRIQASEYTQYVFVFCAVILTLYLLLSFYSSIKRNNKDELFINILLLINLFISFLFYTNESYGYTAIHLVNRYIFAYTFYNLSINIKLIKNKNQNVSKIYFSIEKLATSLSLLFIIITSMFGIVFISTNKTLYTNGLSELAYTNRYDSGRLVNSDMNYVFEGSKNDILNKYQYFVDNNILTEEYNKLEVNKDYNSKDNVRFVRGTKVDGLGERWLNSNFAFEIYVSDVTLSLRIYSPLENNLTLYVNNVEVGTRKVNYGENILSFSIWDFYDENVIVNGIFENDYKGPLNNEGYWSCELMDISFTSDYGYYELDDSGSGWTSTYFGNYYDKITKSLIYKFYLPDGMESNEIEVYVNRNYINNYEVKSGMNNIYIDLNDYINNNVFIEFVLKEAFVSENDSRLLGVILSKVEKYDAINNIEHIIYIDKPYLSFDYNSNEFSQNELELVVGNDKYIYTASGNDYTIKVAEYLEKEISIKEVYKVGVLGSYINNIRLNDTYGIYESDNSNSNWTSNKFGFYVNNANSKKVINLYEIESLDNNYYEIFINGEKTQSGYLKFGMNDVNIDLSNYIGKSVYIDIVLEKYQDGSIDGRILGCIISNFREVD